MIPVEGYIGLFRDEKSGAIVNCNTNEYEEYLKMERKVMTEKEEISKLKVEIAELKSLVSQLLNK